MKKYNIAYIPGDGIGKETGPEGVRVLEAAARKFGIEFKFDEFDWSCDYYAKHGRMMPEDGLEQVRRHDAVFFGAAGWPATVPDHISLWGLLIPFRRNFQQYVNLRPVRLIAGHEVPACRSQAGRHRFLGGAREQRSEYSSIGGRIFDGTEYEWRCSRVHLHGAASTASCALRSTCVQAQAQARDLATKSNGISITMPYWDERFKAMAAQYPDVKPASITSTSCRRIS